MASGISRRTFVKGAAMMAAAGTSIRSKIVFAQSNPPRFDIDQVSKVMFADVDPGASGRGWQSIAGDGVNNRIFYAHPPTSDDSDIRIGFYTPAGHKSPDYMEFTNFGHGQVIGIENAGSDTYIWMETQPEPPTFPHNGHRICRVKWNPNTPGPFTFSDLGTSALPGSEVHQLKPSSHANSCTIDPTNNRLLLRFYWPGDLPSGQRAEDKGHSKGWFYTIYESVDAVRTYGNDAPTVADFIPEHALLADVEGGPFQGITLYGEYAYIITGTQWHNGSANSCERVGDDPGNIYLTCFSISKVGNHYPFYSSHIASEYSYNFREPEGISVYVPPTGSPRLAFTICKVHDCTNSTGIGLPRRETVLYKDLLVTTPLP